MRLVERQWQRVQQHLLKIMPHEMDNMIYIPTVNPLPSFISDVRGSWIVSHSHHLGLAVIEDSNSKLIFFSYQNCLPSDTKNLLWVDIVRRKISISKYFCFTFVV